MSIYTNLTKNENPIIPHKEKIIYHFVDGAFVEILSPISSSYIVKFIDQDKNQVVYQSEINNNCWAKSSTKYFINWKIQVFRKTGELIFEHLYNAKNKNVYISIDSESLGDNLAWIPYIEEFQKAHQCNVVVSTFFNHLFESRYTTVRFVKPGDVVDDLYAMYKIGYCYNPNMEPVLPHTIPLQKAACNILGIDYQEIRPLVNYTHYQTSAPKIVTIATESTSGCKLWTNEGWQNVIYFLVSRGYTVINVSKNGKLFDRAYVLPHDPTLQSTMSVIASSKFFIGLGSGLSWLAWALHTPVVMINNFSEEGHEFTPHLRITNTNVCHGCWNNHRYKFDKGDWNWCPKHQGTDRQFECMKSITSQMVIDRLKTSLISNLDVSQ